MGLRGPPPQSAHILAMRGSSLAASRAAGEPQPEARPPSLPRWLPPDARPVWREVIRQLKGMGILSRADANAIARYVQMFVQWVKLEEFLNANGMTYVVRGRGKKNAAGERELGPIIGVRTYPQVRIAKHLVGEILKIEDRIGLSPSARARLGGMAALTGALGGKGGDASKARFFA